MGVYVLVRPIDPAVDMVFVQLPAATVQAGGSWSASASLGSAEYPATTGDEFELSVIVVETAGEDPPFAVASITQDAIPGLVSASGRLRAIVQIGQ